MTRLLWVCTAAILVLAAAAPKGDFVSDFDNPDDTVGLRSTGTPGHFTTKGWDDSKHGDALHSADEKLRAEAAKTQEEIEEAERLKRWAGLPRFLLIWNAGPLCLLALAWCAQWLKQRREKVRKINRLQAASH